MSAEKATALVLRTTDWSETSRIATLWTREFGRVRALAKGGRRLKSNFETALDLLTLCSIVFLRKSSGSLDLLTEALEGRAGPVASMRALWAWVSDPAHHNVVRFFFESYARSLHDREGAWAGFGETSVREWLPPIRHAVGCSDDEATLLLAVVRGLLLDLLATGDRQRVDAAFERALAGLVSRPGPHAM